jgi:hypothetical protein
MLFSSRLTRTIGTAPEPTTAMAYITIQRSLGGKVVDWMEKVTDEQYAGRN